MADLGRTDREEYIGKSRKEFTCNPDTISPKSGPQIDDSVLVLFHDSIHLQSRSHAPAFGMNLAITRAR